MAFLKETISLNTDDIIRKVFSCSQYTAFKLHNVNMKQNNEYRMSH